MSRPQSTLADVFRDDQVYPQLERVARRLIRGERVDHTLDATALVGEVYLKLRKSQRLDTSDHVAFVGLAARNMRQILVDYANRRNAGKRAHQRVTLCEALVANARSVDTLELDDVLQAIESIYPRAAELLELRIFGDPDLPLTKISRSWNCSYESLKEEWNFAKAQLLRKLAE